MNGRTNSNGHNSNTLQIPLDACTNFIAEPGNGKIMLSWGDPINKYATPDGEQAGDDDQLVSVWAYTKVVKKENSDPIGPEDGNEVVVSAIRDQYKETQYVDTNVVNGVEYHYGVFAVNADGVPSQGSYQVQAAQAYDPTLENNTWAQIDEMCTLGIAASIWSIGDKKNVLIDSEPYPASIVGFDHDDLSDGSGKASITFGIDNRISGYDRYNTNNYASSTMPTGFKETVFMSDYNTILGVIDPDLRAIIKDVNKSDDVRSYDYRYGADTGRINGPYTLTYTIWPFSEIEFLGSSTDGFVNNGGTQYPYYTTSANRQKPYKQGASGSATGGCTSRITWYSIRSDTYGSAYSSCYRRFLGDSASTGSQTTGANFGFCIGKATTE